MIKEEIPVWRKTSVVPRLFLRTEYINRFVMASADENLRKRKLDQGDIRAFFAQRQQGNYSSVRHVRR